MDADNRNIPEDRIKVLGIPCESKFSVTKDRAGLIKELGLEKGFFNLLMIFNTLVPDGFLLPLIKYFSGRSFLFL